MVRREKEKKFRSYLIIPRTSSIVFRIRAPLKLVSTRGLKSADRSRSRRSELISNENSFRWCRKLLARIFREKDVNNVIQSNFPRNLIVDINIHRFTRTIMKKKHGSFPRYFDERVRKRTRFFRRLLPQWNRNDESHRLRGVVTLRIAPVNY